MREKITLGLFVEDAAHENFLRPLIRRIAEQEDLRTVVNDKSARGGHPRVIDELKIYIKSILKGGIPRPDLIVVAVDTNCSSYNRTRTNILEAVDPVLSDAIVCACPEPHIERWFFADQAAFTDVVGPYRALPKRKCGRDFYKRALKEAVTGAGHPTTLGGIEFAEEIVAQIDIYRAGRGDTSLKHFVADLSSRMKMLKQGA